MVALRSLAVFFLPFFAACAVLLVVCTPVPIVCAVLSAVYAAFPAVCTRSQALGFKLIRWKVKI